MKPTRRTWRSLAIVAATAVILPVLAAPIAMATPNSIQPSSVTVSQLTSYAGEDYLNNCGTSNPNASPGDYSFENNTNEGTTTGDDTGGLSYNFGFPVSLNDFDVTLTAPAPAEPAGVPGGVYGTTFPPVDQHIDQSAADTNYGCNVGDFTVYNYAIGLTINGENWLYTPDGGVVNAAQNEVTLPVHLPGTSATITAATGVQNGAGPSGTVTYTCNGSCNGLATGEEVSISELGSASGSSLNLSDVIIASASYNSFTVTTNPAVIGVSMGDGVVATVGIAEVTAMTVYVANVVNPPAGNYPGFDYTVDVDDLDAGSTNIYSTVPAPASTASLTYHTTGTGDALTSSLAISTNSISATNIPSEGATVTATVRDQYWNPIPNETVYVGVEQPLSGAIFTEPVTPGTGAGGLPQTGDDGTVQYYVWGTKSTAPDLPAALFAQATSPDSFYFGAPQMTTVTEATGNGDSVTYTGDNTFTAGQQVDISGLPVTSNGDNPDVEQTVSSSNTTSFTTAIGGIYGTSTGEGIATAAGLAATSLTGSSNGSVVTIDGTNEFSSGEIVELGDFAFANEGGAIEPPSIGVVLSSGADFFTAYLLFPFFGASWPQSYGTGTGGYAVTDENISAATVTAAVGDGTNVTYTANNDFYAGQSVNVQGLGVASGESLDIANLPIGSVAGNQFTVPDDLTGVSSGTGIATAGGPETVTMAVTAASPNPPSAGVAFNDIGSKVQACSGGSPCSDDSVTASVEVGNGEGAGGVATVTVTLADQFGNYDADRAVELSPLQPASGPTESFKDLTIKPLEPANNNSTYTTCDQGPAADLPGISCTDSYGTTSFLVSDTMSEIVSFQIVDVTDGFTMPTTDLPPTDAPNIPIVTFSTGPVDPANSTVEVDGGSLAYVPANGTTTATVAVTLRDQFGNPETGVTTTLAGTTGSPVTVTAASGDGSAITYLTANTFTAGESVTVAGLGDASGASLNLANATIATATATQFTVASALVGLASGTGTATPGEHDVVTAVNDSHCTSAPTPGATDCNGQSWFTVADAHLETVTYTASEAGTAIPEAGTPTVYFVTGAVSYENSTVSVNPGTVVGNGRGTATVTVTIKDGGSHPLDGISVALNPADDATITAASGNGTTVTYTAANNFTTGQLVTIVGLGQLSGASLNLTDVTIASADATTFTVTNDTVGLASGSGTATLSYANLTIVPPDATTNANGQATFAVTAGAFPGAVTLPTTVEVPVDVSPPPLIGTTPIPSSLVANISFAPTPTNTSVTASPVPATATVTAASGNGTTVTYTATNGFSPGQSVSITGLTVASGTSLDLLAVTIQTASGSQFTVANTTVGVAGGTGTATVSTPVATGGDDETITANVLDGPNPATNGINGLSLELVDTNGDAFGTQTTNADGQTTFDVSLSPTAPNMTITYVVKDLSDGGRVVGTATVTYVPEATEADESTVTAAPATVYTYNPRDEAGFADQQTATVTVHLVNDEGDSVTDEPVYLAASSPFADVDGNPIDNTALTNGNGVAAFSVTDCDPGVGVTCAPADVTAATGDGTTVTYTADNDFSIGQTVSITGLGIASGDSLNLTDVHIASASGSQFTVTSSVVGTALVGTASVTAATGDGTTVTYTAANSFSPGQTVTVNGLGIASGASLDLADVTVSTASPTQFTVTNAATGTASGTGTATAPGVATPQPVAEDVTFTAEDLGSTVTVAKTATVDFVLRPDEAIESTITATPNLVEADGTNAATVTVTLRNNGVVVPGDLVSLSQGSGHAIITSPDPVSDLLGQATFAVVNLTPEDVVFQATDLTTATTLNNVAIVDFTAPPGGTLTPSVTSVSPATGPGLGGDPVIITGTNLLGATAVWFGAVQSPTYSVSPSGTSLTAISPIPVAAGAINVTVTGPGGTSAITSADIYTYSSGPPLTVEAVSPDYGPVAGNTTTTITGTDFASTKSVHVGATSATYKVIDGGQALSVTVPKGTGPGTVSVSVQTATATSAATAETTYTYIGAVPAVAVPKPSITRVTPTSGAMKGGTKVTIKGKDFAGIKTVYFGTTKAVVLGHTATTLVVKVPAAKTAGTVNVAVVTAAGRSVSVKVDRYTYTAPKHATKKSTKAVVK